MTLFLVVEVVEAVIEAEDKASLLIIVLKFVWTPGKGYFITEKKGI